MDKPRFNYVRTFRQRHALSERDLAFLISRTQTTISAMEYGDLTPTLDAALALQVLFRLPPKELFPECYERAEERVMRRAADLIVKMQDKTDRRTAAKLDFLENLASEASDIEL